MKKFETPEIEAIEFAVEDVITASGEGTGDEIINTTSCPPPMPIP